VVQKPNKGSLSPVCLFVCVLLQQWLHGAKCMRNFGHHVTLAQKLLNEFKKYQREEGSWTHPHHLRLFKWGKKERLNSQGSVRMALRWRDIGRCNTAGVRFGGLKG